MARWMIFPVSFVMITAQCWAQQSEPAWLYPTDTALLEAARRGLDREKPEFGIVYRGPWGGKGSIFGCREKTQRIMAVGPLGLATIAGQEARKRFETLPALENIIGTRGAIGLMVVFLSKESGTRVEGALMQGEMIFRPEILEEEEDVQRVGCRTEFVGLHPYNAEYTWEISRVFVFHFERGKSQPDWNQPVKLVLRRSDGKEEAFQFDLHHTLQSKRHEKEKNNDEAWPEPSNRARNSNDSQQLTGPAGLSSNSSAATKSPDTSSAQSQLATSITSVAITSAPAGAEIYLDQNFVGNTPSTVNAPSGKHSIYVKKRGFQDWVREMAFTGGTVTLMAELVQGSSPPAAALNKKTYTVTEVPLTTPRGGQSGRQPQNSAAGVKETARGWIGITVKHSMLGGAVVTAIIPNSPAAGAGLEVGDIVTEVNGIPLKEEDLVEKIAQYKSGTKLRIVYIRSAWAIEATVTVGTSPN